MDGSGSDALSYCDSIWLKGLSKTTKIITEISRCPERDSKQEPLKHKPDMPSLEPTFGLPSVFITAKINYCRPQWPSGLRGRLAADRLLRLRVWIPPRAWVFVSCECCMLLGRGLCDGLITRPEESYQLWCVLVCDFGTSKLRRLRLLKGCNGR